MHFWCHPIDFHFKTTAINGWPKVVFRVWRVDDADKIDVFAYGLMNLPRTPGYVEIECNTWIPFGNSSIELNRQSFFLGN